MDLKNRPHFAASRELLRWIEKHELSYRISNFKHDLSNGFLIAEIISNYDKTLNMNAFYQSQELAKVRQNWEILYRFLSPKMPLTQIKINQIIFLEPDAAESFLLDLYVLFTGKKRPKHSSQDDKSKENRMHHQQTTISNLMRNRKILNIVDVGKRLKEIWNRIETHVDQAKVAKDKLDLKTFKLRKRREIIERKMTEIQKKDKKSTIVNQETELLSINLKNYQNKQSSSNSHLNYESEKVFVKSMLETVFEKYSKHLLLDKTVDFTINQEMIKGIISCPSEFEPEITIFLLQVLAKGAKDIFSDISSDFSRISVFFELLIEFVMQLPTDTILLPSFKLFLSSLKEFQTPASSDFVALFMENKGLIMIRDANLAITGKRDFLASLIFYFLPDQDTTFANAVCKLKDFHGDRIDLFFKLLSRFSEFHPKEDSDFLYFNTLLYYALMAIRSSSTLKIVDGVKIMSNIVSIFPVKIISEVKLLDVDRMIKSGWWELKATLIILISNIILFLYTTLQEAEENPNNLVDGENKPNKSLEHIPEKMSNDVKNIIEFCHENIEYFEKMGLKVFRSDENLNVIKIGIVYFAFCIQRFNSFTESYFNVLMSIKTDILELLLSEERIGEPFRIVWGINAFHYLQTAAHKFWNPLAIIQAMNSKLLNSPNQAFDSKICLIFVKCLRSDIPETKKDDWVKVFKSFHFRVIEELANEKVCTNVLDIFSILLSYDFFLQVFISECSKKLYEVMVGIYEEVNPHVHNNFKEFLQMVYQEKQNTPFMYQLLKKFSEEQYRSYCDSNLIELMNSVSASRRTQLYGESIWKQVIESQEEKS